MTSDPRELIVGQLARTILALDKAHPRRVAIDGPDAAGKTTLADELAQRLRAEGRRVIRASIDGFHRPRRERYARYGDSPEAFYRDSFDHDSLRSALLLPLGPGGSRAYRTAVFDFRTDQPRVEPDRFAHVDDILLFDGIFLLRPELLDCWDYRIFLHVDFAETLRRAMDRDRSLFGSPDEARERYRRKYIPGQELYFSEARPRSLADTIVDNTAVEHPFVIG